MYFLELPLLFICLSCKLFCELGVLYLSQFLFYSLLFLSSFILHLPVILLLVRATAVANVFVFLFACVSACVFTVVVVFFGFCVVSFLTPVHSVMAPPQSRMTLRQVPRSTLCYGRTPSTLRI